jgi:hypothetical protein
LTSPPTKETDGWIDEKFCYSLPKISPPTSFLYTNGSEKQATGKMKDIYKDEEFDIPEGVSVNIKSRLITVKGPRGELTKSLHHIDMEIKKIGDRKIKLVVWHGGRKHVACLRTVRSLITNMINGVTKVRMTLFKRLVSQLEGISIQDAICLRPFPY